jgi:hypothetical protein
MGERRFGRRPAIGESDPEHQYSSLVAPSHGSYFQFVSRAITNVRGRERGVSRPLSWSYDMNVRMKADRPQRAYPKLLPDKPPSTVALPLDARATRAANHETVAGEEEPPINPLWMISVALGVLFGLLLMLSGG